MNMKTIINTIVATALLALTATTATARSWRIHNDAAKAADFTSINAAMSSEQVQAGDTLYLDPGCCLASKQTISKQVTVVGTGYFSARTPTAYVTADIDISAPGTKLEGISISGSTFVMAQDVTIERCYTAAIRLNSSNGINANNCTIRQCYVTGSIYGYDRTHRGQYTTIENNIIICSGKVILDLSNANIRNNYISQTGNGSSYYNFYYVNHSILENNIVRNVYNNVDHCWVYLEDSQLANNIILFAAAGTYFTDQIYGYTAEADIFCMEGGNDLQYRLKEGSPAKGAATDGGDCGPYGGATPYVPGGLPQGHPYYLQYGVSSRAVNDKVNVNLKIQLQDE